MRVLLALGGNAMTNADGRARVEDQIAAARIAMESVADLVAEDIDVVLTHGNGPQVGNLLVKNELAAAVVPPVPLDWCGAQTQATLGFVLMNALDAALTQARARPAQSPPWSPGRWSTPTTRASPSRPSRSGATSPRTRPQLLIEHGQIWEDRGREGLAAGGRLARAAGDPRRAGGRRADRRRVRGRRCRRRRHPGRARRRRRAARRRGGHRQGPRRRPAGPGGRRRRAGHRHRRARTRSSLRHPEAEPVGQATVERDARATPPRATSPAARWGPRSRPPAGSSSTAAAGRDHHPGPHRRSRDRRSGRQTSTGTVVVPNN